MNRNRSRGRCRGLFFLLALLWAVCVCVGAYAGPPPPNYNPVAVRATYYGQRFDGKRMADGQVYDHRRFTVASNDYPFGTELVIIGSGKAVIGTVTDRMPTRAGKRKSVDLSDALFDALGLDRKKGSGMVLLVPRKRASRDWDFRTTIQSQIVIRRLLWHPRWDPLEDHFITVNPVGYYPPMSDGICADPLVVDPFPVRCMSLQ